MLTRNNWKRSQKKFGKLKKKRQRKYLTEGKAMKRGIDHPKTRRESKDGNSKI